MKVLLAKLLKTIKMQIKIFFYTTVRKSQFAVEILRYKLKFLVYTCVSGPQKITVIYFSIVYTCEFLDNNSLLVSRAK